MLESLAHAGAVASMIVIAACLIFMAYGEVTRPLFQTCAIAIFSLVFCSLASDDDRP